MDEEDITPVVQFVQHDSRSQPLQPSDVGDWIHIPGTEQRDYRRVDQ